MILEPTLRCDGGCGFCYQRRPHADAKELSPEQLEQLLSVARPRQLKLIGGEVLLRPDAGRLLAAAARRCEVVTLTTNGAHLTRELTRQLRAMGSLARVGVSICGVRPPAANLLASLAGAVPVVAQVLVRPQAAQEVNRAIAALPAMGVRTVLLMQEMWSTPEELERTRALLAEDLGWDHGWELHALSRDAEPEPLHRLHAAMGSALAAARQAGVLAWPEVGYTDDAGDRFHLGHAEAGRAICRYLLWPTARVDPAGQVIFCEHLRRPLGDLTAAPPGRIWNGRSARALRRYLLERGPLPVCRRCCKLVHLG